MIFVSNWGDQSDFFPNDTVFQLLYHAPLESQIRKLTTVWHTIIFAVNIIFYSDHFFLEFIEDFFNFKYFWIRPF